MNAKTDKVIARILDMNRTEMHAEILKAQQTMDEHKFILPYKLAHKHKGARNLPPLDPALIHMHATAYTTARNRKKILTDYMQFQDEYHAAMQASTQS